MRDSLRVVISPDSFKGTLSAEAAARAIASGWASVRPNDVLQLLPQADGGEGTADALAHADAQSVWMSAGRVAGPDGRDVEGRWLQLSDGSAVVELAQMNGITLMSRLDPDRASTRGFGQVIRSALEQRPSRLLLCLGGSASNDGGAGAMAALGASLLTDERTDIADGAAGLDHLAVVDATRAVPPPPGGVLVLSDVTSPLFGRDGATAVFGPQKGIDASRRDEFDGRLRRLADLIDVDSARPGMGAAGGTAFGLAALWDIEFVSGARFVAETTGLTAAARTADVLVSGEGSFDGQSGQGKVVGFASDLARVVGTDFGVIAGRIVAEPEGLGFDLTDIAGSADLSMRHPARFAEIAGATAARAFADLAAPRGGIRR